MGAFLYFLPDVQAAGLEVIERFGLTDRLPPGSTTWVGITGAGPEGKRGVMVAYQPPGEHVRLGYYADEQCWHRAPRADYLVGWWTEDPPTPTGLQRIDGLAGHAVQLGDEQEWIVPVAVLCEGGNNLEQALTLGDAGELVANVAGKHARIWEHALRVRDNAFIGMGLRERGDVPELTEREEWDYAVEALALNYRVGAPEVSLLHLLTTTTMRAVLMAVVDVPTMQRIGEALLASEKKTATTPAGSAS